MNAITSKLDPISLFPDELGMEIFSLLNLSSLGKICQVSKSWKQLADEPILWRNAVYKEIAFGSDKWGQFCGEEVVKDEDRREELSSLPWKEFIADYNKFKVIFPGKNAKNSLMIVRLPKTLNGGLTLNSLGELAKKFFQADNSGYSYIFAPVNKELINQSIDKSLWVIVTQEGLPEGSNKSYTNQQEIVARLAEKSLGGYEISDALKYTACILSQYFSSSASPRDNPWTSKRCVSKDNVGGSQIVVGGSDKGLVIAPGVDFEEVAVLREKFQQKN